ncbi:MAG: enoyl-CoA hydratase-related protein, partial [Sphingomonas sp.]|uniref:enoyl-CoA hydratase-related protein n=1 Tax=Sphingomonas sp. TaxID=28214 RepID=UPI003F82028D
RAALASYTERVTNRDVEAVLELFAANATLEDPVGSGRIVTGTDALRDFYTEICGRGMVLRIDGHVSCARANTACAPIRIDVDDSVTRDISVVRFDDAGLIERYDAYWGPGDVERVGQSRERRADCLGTYEHILIHRRGRIVTIALDRPEKLNAFNARLHTELALLLQRVADDPDSDIVVLTGSGRAFSAGGDIGWQQAAYENPSMFEATVREAKQIIFAMLDCEKPIIAKINGPAVGLGATIALFSDVSFIAETAHIADPHVSVGMVAGDGGALIWPQLVGLARAKHYLLTGDPIDAREAVRIGLVNFIAPEGDLDAMVDAYADRLAAGAQLAIRYSKLTINTGIRALAASAMDVGLGYESVTNMTEDHREALAAFRERRKPNFGAHRRDA